MQFQKIEGFKKMTEEAMRNTVGGGGADTLQKKTYNTVYTGTSTTCGTGSRQNADPCVLQDIKSITQD